MNESNPLVKREDTAAEYWRQRALESEQNYVMYSEEERIEDLLTENERMRTALSRICAATMSQYADTSHMAVSFKRIARDALYPGGDR